MKNKYFFRAIAWSVVSVMAFAALVFTFFDDCSPSTQVVLSIQAVGYAFLSGAHFGLNK